MPAPCRALFTIAAVAMLPTAANAALDAEMLKRYARGAAQHHRFERSRVPGRVEKGSGPARQRGKELTRQWQEQFRKP